MDLCKQSVRAIAQRTRWNSSLSKREGNWTPFLKRRRKVFYVCRVCIQDSSFNNSDNDTMKLSVNEAKLTGLWARNCATITKVLILNLPSGPKSFRAFQETGPWGRVNFRKDFWDCYWRQGKSWPMADQLVPSNDPWNNFTTHFGSSSLLFSANCIFLSPA